MPKLAELACMLLSNSGLAAVRAGRIMGFLVCSVLVRVCRLCTITQYLMPAYY